MLVRSVFLSLLFCCNLLSIANDCLKNSVGYVLVGQSPFNEKMGIDFLDYREFKSNLVCTDNPFINSKKMPELRACLKEVVTLACDCKSIGKDSVAQLKSVKFFIDPEFTNEACGLCINFEKHLISIYISGWFFNLLDLRNVDHKKVFIYMILCKLSHLVFDAQQIDFSTKNQVAKSLDANFLLQNKRALFFALELMNDLFKDTEKLKVGLLQDSLSVAKEYLRILYYSSSFHCQTEVKNIFGKYKLNADTMLVRNMHCKCIIDKVWQDKADQNTERAIDFIDGYGIKESLDLKTGKIIQLK